MECDRLESGLPAGYRRRTQRRNAMTTRRVVTGTNADGKAYFVHDGPTPGSLDIGTVATDEIWVDDPGNPDPTAATDPVDVEQFHLEPPAGGSVLRIFTFRPENVAPPLTMEAIVAAAARFDTGGVMETEDVGMHTTKTIDYGIVLSGEIVLELDDGAERLLTAGDVVVQRGTRHAWRNRSDADCVVAFVLIGSPNYQ